MYIPDFEGRQFTAEDILAEPYDLGNALLSPIQAGQQLQEQEARRVCAGMRDGKTFTTTSELIKSGVFERLDAECEDAFDATAEAMIQFLAASSINTWFSRRPGCWSDCEREGVLTDINEDVCDKIRSLVRY